MICYKFGSKPSSKEQTKNRQLIKVLDNKKIADIYLKNILNVPNKQYVPILEYILEKYQLNSKDEKEVFYGINLLIYFTLYN